MTNKLLNSALERGFAPPPDEILTPGMYLRPSRSHAPWYRLGAAATLTIGAADQVTSTLDYVHDHVSAEPHVIFGFTLLVTVLARVQWERQNGLVSTVGAKHMALNVIKRWIFLLLYGLAVIKGIAIIVLSLPAVQTKWAIEPQIFDDFRAYVVSGVLSVVAAHVALKANRNTR